MDARAPLVDLDDGATLAHAVRNQRKQHKESAEGKRAPASAPGEQKSSPLAPPRVVPPPRPQYVASDGSLPILPMMGEFVEADVKPQSAPPPPRQRRYSAPEVYGSWSGAPQKLEAASSSAHAAVHTPPQSAPESSSSFLPRLSLFARDFFNTMRGARSPEAGAAGAAITRPSPGAQGSSTQPVEPPVVTGTIDRDVIASTYCSQGQARPWPRDQDHGGDSNDAAQSSVQRGFGRGGGGGGGEGFHFRTGSEPDPKGSSSSLTSSVSPRFESTEQPGNEQNASSQSCVRNDRASSLPSSVDKAADVVDGPLSSLRQCVSQSVSRVMDVLHTGNLDGCPDEQPAVADASAGSSASAACSLPTETPNVDEVAKLLYSGAALP